MHPYHVCFRLKKVTGIYSIAQQVLNNSQHNSSASLLLDQPLKIEAACATCDILISR